MFDVPPDLRERKWRIQPIEQVVPLALSKLFLFSTSEQFDKFIQGVTTIQANLNHQGELSLYEGEDRVRFSTWTIEKEKDTSDSITDTDFRLARQIETFYTNLMKEGTPKPALFLDFDGTVRDVVEDPTRAHKGGFRAPYRPEEVEVYPQVSDILEMWDEEGYFLVGATNQSGVGRGDLTEASAVECIEETVNQIGIGFPVFYSTSKKAANYKPRIGMGLEVIEEHGPFDLDESIMVGDNHRGGDENFAYNLGIKFIHADDFFHLSKDQRKGRAAESFTTLNSEFFSEFAFRTESRPPPPCFPTMTLFNAVAPKFFDQPTREDLSKKKIPELKQQLRSEGLTVSGNKPELIKRLLEHYYQTPCEKFAQNPHLPAAFTENWTEWCQGTVSDLEWIPTARMSAPFLRDKIEEWEQGDIKDYYLNKLSRNPHLPSEIIEEYWKKFDIYSLRGHLSENPSLTPEIIENHWGVWEQDYLTLNPSLTPEIIENHWDEWDKSVLVQNHEALTTEIVERHWDELLPVIKNAPSAYTYYFDANTQDEHGVSKVFIWPNLPPTWITPELIEKGWGHWGDVDSLGKIPALTMALITKYESSFSSPNYLAMNPNLTQTFILKNHDNSGDIADDFAKNPNPEILKFLLHNSGIYTDSDAATPRYHMARNPNLTEELMEKYWDKWDYDDIARNPSLSAAMIEAKWSVTHRGDLPLKSYFDSFLGKNPALFPCGNAAGPAGFPLGIVNWRF